MVSISRSIAGASLLAVITAGATFSVSQALEGATEDLAFAAGARLNQAALVHALSPTRDSFDELEELGLGYAEEGYSGVVYGASDGSKPIFVTVISYGDSQSAVSPSWSSRKFHSNSLAFPPNHSLEAPLDASWTVELTF